MSSNAQAKRDFGSFQSSNVEELVRLDESVYVAPRHAVLFDKSKYEYLKDVDFGTKRIKEELFNLDSEFCFLNHGAFGLCFKPVLEYTFKWQLYAESQPLRFYDRDVLPLLVEVVRRFAKLLKCKPIELVLVENCTFAFNSILKSIDLKANEKIFIFSTTYGVYKKILRKYCADRSAVLVEQTVKFPILSKNDMNLTIVEKFKEALKEDEESRLIKYVIIDHIPSNQPFLFPINEIIELCRTRSDIVSVVDAAHTLGSISDFDFEKCKPDILFGNCHKWLSGPKGTAILYKREGLSNIYLQSAVQSHGIGNGYHSEFLWAGLKDYCSFLGLHATLDLWECMGGFTKPIDYCTKLTKQAAEHLRNTWSTEYLVHPDLCSTMICIKLPLNFVNKCISNANNDSNTDKLTYDQAEIVQNYLYNRHKIEVPIKSIDNSLYVRISCHIYNNIDDYKHLANIVLIQ